MENGFFDFALCAALRMTKETQSIFRVSFFTVIARTLSEVEGAVAIRSSK